MSLKKKSKASKKRLSDMVCRLKKQEWDERSKVLAEHNKKWENIKIKLQTICEKHGGHEFVSATGVFTYISNAREKICSICDCVN